MRKIIALFWTFSKVVDVDVVVVDNIDGAVVDVAMF